MDASLDSEQTLIVLFGSAKTETIEKPLEELVVHFPKSTIIGASSAGEIAGDELLEDGMVVAVLHFEHTHVRFVSQINAVPEDSYESGSFIARKLLRDDLGGIFVLSDGLHVNGSQLTKGINTILPQNIPVTGGLAGDDDRFENSSVTVDGSILTINGTFLEDDFGTVFVDNVYDLNGNLIDPANSNAEVMEIIMPHLVGTFNNWDTSNHDYELILQDNGLWQCSTELNVGTHEYKVLESDDWNGHDFPVNNQVFTLAQSTEVTFFVNCGVVVSYGMNDEYVFHSPNPPVVCGSFLSEIGGTDWNVNTSVTQMNDNGTNGDDTENDGIYTFQTGIPQGYYEYKIVLNNNWDQNTTVSNIPLNLISDSNVTFFYNMVENIVCSEINGTAVEDNIQYSIENFQLQVYPNPFNSQTTISFATMNLHEETRIEIYNIKGQKVKSLECFVECINYVDAKATQSLYSIIWDGTNNSKKPVSSGIYFINLRSGNKNLIKKAMLMR